MLSSINRFFFEQADPYARLAAFRINLAALIVLLVALGPYGEFHITAAEILRRPHGLQIPLPNLNHGGFLFLRLSVIFSAILVGLGWKTRFTSWALFVSLYLFNSYVASFGNFWNYNTHLHFFALVLCFAPVSVCYSLDSRRNSSRVEPGSKASASFAIAFPQFFVGLIYLNAGLSKLVLGGISWFLTGDSLRSYIVFASGYSRYEHSLILADFPLFFPIAGIATGIFEFGFIFALLSGMSPRILGVLALAMHAGIEVFLDVSFYHLWLVYPSLFFFRSNKSHGIDKESRHVDPV